MIEKREGASAFPILEELLAAVEKAEERHDIAGIVYAVLRSLLTADLTLVQYKYIARDVEQFWLQYIHRLDTTVETKISWIIRQYLLKKYFADGLFLDDIRVPKDLCNYMDEIAILPYLLGNWTVVRTYEEFVDCISKDSAYERISFDHDLGEDRKGRELPSGYDALKWLVDQVLDENMVLPEVWCHSQNPVGKANILGYWESFRRSLQVG